MKAKINPKVGNYYESGGDIYIIALVKRDLYCLVNIKTGNRFTDATEDMEMIFAGDDDCFKKCNIRLAVKKEIK